MKKKLCDFCQKELSEVNYLYLKQDSMDGYGIDDSEEYEFCWYGCLKKWLESKIK